MKTKARSQLRRWFTLALMFAAVPALADHVISGSINLNQASAAQLDLLPGVGPKAAARIIAHRTKTPFQKPEDLTQVKGFGQKKFEKLKAVLTVAGPTTLRVGTGPSTTSAQARRSPSGQ